MEDKPDFSDVGTDNDPEGQVETRQVQKLNRVDIPDEFMDFLDLGHQDRIMVICREDRIVIKEATANEVL